MGKSFRASSVKSGPALKYTDANFGLVSEYVEVCKHEEVDFFHITASESSFKAIIKKIYSEGVISLIPEERERRRNRIYSWEFSKHQLWEWLKLDKESQVLADFLLNRQESLSTASVGVAGLTLEELDNELLNIEKRRRDIEEQKKGIVRGKILSHLHAEFGLTEDQAVKYLR